MGRKFSLCGPVTLVYVWGVAGSIWFGASAGLLAASIIFPKAVGSLKLAGAILVGSISLFVTILTGIEKLLAIAEKWSVAEKLFHRRSFRLPASSSDDQQADDETI